MPDEPEYPYDNFMEGLKATARHFENEYDDLEATLEGEIGFHTFFVAEGDDPTRGTHTAIYQGLYDVIQEVSIDRDIIEHNQGEVTPETARTEAIEQLHQFTYLPEVMIESIGDRVEDRVRKNMAQRVEQ